MEKDKGARAKKGAEAGTKCGGYYLIWLDGTQYKLHRIIWMMIEGIDPKELEVDHKDRNGLNNSASNLRTATSTQQKRNRKMKGYYWSKVSQKWAAYIDPTKKRVHLGLFEREEDAIKARKEAELKYYGEFAPI